MKVSYRELKNIIEDIPNNQKIIVSGHVNPDMDSIGSSLALTRYLNKIGKIAICLLEYNIDYKKIVPTIGEIENIKIVVGLLIEKDKIEVLLKSYTNIEVEPLARILGGGGHKYAAGGTSV